MAETSSTTTRKTRRRQMTGVVQSDARDKTIKVVVSFLVKHPKYGKYIRRRTTLHAHDPQNEARVGDTVEVMECRPISKQKSWRLLRVLNRVAQVEARG